MATFSWPGRCIAPRANGKRLRDMVLSKGHTLDYGPMFRAFYGKDPDIGPLLKQRGLAGKPN